MAVVLYRSVMFFLRLLEFLVFARVIMSWLFAFGSTNSFSELIFDLTEFLLAPIRNLLRRTILRGSVLDFSPIILCMLIEFAKRLVTHIFVAFIF